MKRFHGFGDSGVRMTVCCSLFLAVLLFTIHFSVITVFAEESPLNSMRDDILSYFKPLKGRVVSSGGGTAVADLGTSSQVKKGMRFTVFREGNLFLHPVTKEPIGMLESVVGEVEVKDAGPDTANLIVIKGDIKPSDRLRISETGIRMLFYQGRGVDWTLADAYYRTLKESGRFELIDTSLETDNDADVMAEAKKLNADIVLMLSMGESTGEAVLKQKLVWADNSAKIAESEAKFALGFIKELKFGEEFFGPQKSDTKLAVALPSGARMIATGDTDGDGKAEVLISTGKDIRFYMPNGEVSKVYEIKGAGRDDHLWLDAMDLNKNNRDEVIVTYMKDEAIISRIYELADNKFSVIWEGNVFLKRIGNELFAQAYAQGEGYKGPVFSIIWDNGYKKGGNITLPEGVDIYDFAYISEVDGKKLVLAYDGKGYLNLYDEGKLMWHSKEDYGGILTTFKKSVPSVMVDRGEWSVKDRLLLQKREIFVIKREPFFTAAKGIGYTKSNIRSLWWTGISMEERIVVDGISGNVLDYAFAGDMLVVLDKPVLVSKVSNILKGESPFGTVLLMYSLKGR